MDNKEINTIIEEHGRYLLRLDGGKKADFIVNKELHGWSRADLRGVVFKDAVLIDADFCFADLDGADFRGADLRFANFHNAGLGGADFRGADLRGANLKEAIVEDANFLKANLAGATMEKWVMNNAALTQNQRDSVIVVED